MLHEHNRGNRSPKVASPDTYNSRRSSNSLAWTRHSAGRDVLFLFQYPSLLSESTIMGGSCSLDTYIGHRIGEVPRDATGWIPSIPNGSECTEVDAYTPHVGCFLDSAWGRAR